MWPLRGVRVIAFITATHCVQPVFDILLMVEQKSSLWKIDAGAPDWPSQGRETAAEPGALQEKCQYGKYDFKNNTRGASAGAAV